MLQEIDSGIFRLTDRESRFIERYASHLNIAKAAREAKLSKPEAEALLASPIGEDAFQYLSDQISEESRVDAAMVLGGLKDVYKRSMQLEPVTDRNGDEVGIYKYDSSAALKSLELMGKHLRLFTDKVEHSMDTTAQAFFASIMGTNSIPMDRPPIDGEVVQSVDPEPTNASGDSPQRVTPNERSARVTNAPDAVSARWMDGGTILPPGFIHTDNGDG